MPILRSQGEIRHQDGGGGRGGEKISKGGESGTGGGGLCRSHSGFAPQKADHAGGFDHHHVRRIKEMSLPSWAGVGWRLGSF